MIDGISRQDIEKAMKVRILEILNSKRVKGVKRISARNYGGNLGPYLFNLKSVIK